MTSSRRSSTHTLWRSIAPSKNSTPPTLSFIFAQPENAAPSASAATKLQSPSRILVLKESSAMKSRSISPRPRPAEEQHKNGDGPSTSGTSPQSPGASPSASTESLAPPLALASDAASPTREAPAPASAQGTITDPVSADPPVPLPSPPPTDVSRTLDNKSPQEKSSWFGSVSRSKGKSKEVARRIENDGDSPSVSRPSITQGNTATTPALPPSVCVQPLTPPQLMENEPGKPEPLLSQPHPVPPQPYPGASQSPPIHSQTCPIPSQPRNDSSQLSSQHASKRSWFSSSPTAPSPLGPSLPNAAAPAPNHTPASPSIDNQSPIIQSAAPTPPPASPGTARDPLDGDCPDPHKPSPPDPSTSRFTLSIPLLGKQKMSLDQVVAAARAEAPEQATSVDSKHVSDGTSDGETHTPGQEEHIHQVSTATPSGPSDNPSPDTPQTAAADSGVQQRSSSWWDYITWGTAPALQDLPGQPPTTPSSSEKDTSAANPETVDSEPASVVPDGKNQLPVNDADNAQQESTPHESGATDGGAPPARKAVSIRSAETSQSQGSAWYYPWGWYGAAPSLPPREEGSASASGTGLKTESEIVKEEALARPEEPAAPSMDIPAPISVFLAPEHSNPMESTISANRLGWASFFSSKALAVKSITAGEAQRDENGMEVMDLDDDVPPKTEASSPVAVPVMANSKEGAAGQPAKGRDMLSSSPKKANGSAEPSNSPIAPPLTSSTSLKRETAIANKRPSGSPAPSKKSGTSSPSPRPNLVLPTWADTFHSPPRSLVPPPPTSSLTKTLRFVSGVLFAGEESGKGKAKEGRFSHFGKVLPRAWDVSGTKLHPDVLGGCRKVVVIGIHGWFPGAFARTVIGEPTGTSTKFVNMMVQALEEFQLKHSVTFEKITKIPLEGEGTIETRVSKLYSSMLENQEWMDDLRAAEVVFVATHSQGCIVSTHLLDRLIRDGHIRTVRNAGALEVAASVSAASVGVPPARPQKICCLALCGIHLGPLRYLNSSTVLQPYFQYFESAAARELFQFQNTESQVSIAYAKALKNIVDNGTKMVYVGSLNDQAVPLYSALFASVSHPLILRALYIDGDAYHSSDFLSNLLVLLLRIFNSGLSDSGLLAHLSEATAGSLNGVGHSTAYEELSTYSLAANYLFLTDDGLEGHPELKLEPFNAATEQNDYEIPWALRDLIADERVAHFFADEISQLRDAFREWQPRTTALRDVKRKLQPIQRLPSVGGGAAGGSASKL